MKSSLVTVIVAILVITAYYFGKRLYLKPKIQNGVEAFELNGTIPNGNEFKLSDLKGKFVLLDFWGSWCKPCRESHPELIQLYKDFNSAEFKNASGFEIVSFGVEQNQQNWKSAITQDGLLWPYQLVSTDLFNSP